MTDAKTARNSPGPWVLKRVACDIGCCDVWEVFTRYPEDAEYERRVAHVDGDNAVWLREGEAEANASLISAAPDLLAIVESLVRGENPGAAATAAAIAKARGGK